MLSFICGFLIVRTLQQGQKLLLSLDFYQIRENTAGQIVRNVPYNVLTQHYNGHQPFPLCCVAKVLRHIPVTS